MKPRVVLILLFLLLGLLIEALGQTPPKQEPPKQEPPNIALAPQNYTSTIKAIVLHGPVLELITVQRDQMELIRVWREDRDITGGKAPLVVVHLDGSATYGPDAKPNEAATAFWKALATGYPEVCRELEKKP